LFEPFERGGNVRVCQWNEAGRIIEEAVPDLYEAIKGYPVWRAIILAHPVQNDNEQDDELKYESPNPFDFRCNHKRELPIEENRAPLVRLTHMLAGFPSLGVKGYQIAYTVNDEDADAFKDFTLMTKTGKEHLLLQRDIENLKDEKQRKKWKDKIFAKHGSNIMPNLYEESYEPDEKAAHKKLTEKYALKENRPAEVLILSTREIATVDEREVTIEEVRRAWQFYDEEESSDFWKVYPNICRFIYYDLLNQEHTLYKRDLWRFYLLALTLAVNQIPSDTLQAYHLYKADLDVNRDELNYVLGGHIENLTTLQAIIQERMLRVPNLTLEKQKELVPTRDISVKFENVDESNVKVDSGKLGLAADCPVSETRFWRGHIQETKQTIDNILSAPQEIVVEKALETRRTVNSFLGIEQVLDRFQLERVSKRRDELEPLVINSNVYGMLDADTYKAEVAEAGNAVRKFIGLRLTKRNILLISLCSLFTYLCGYIPYFINSARINRQTFGAAFGLALIALVLLAAGGLLTLWFMRRKLVNKLKTYNKTVMRIFDRVNKGAKVFSDYFSSVCTYMYAHSLLSGVILKQDNDFSAANVLKAHLSTIKNEIEADKELCVLYDVPVNESSMSGAFSGIKEEALLEMPGKGQLYELVPNKEKGSMELGNTGETLYAPYSFIAGISLVREEIYDRKGA
jgi:hypothetical protein